MREIEVKARVDNLTTIVEALQAQNVAVTAPVNQHDIVYGPDDVNGDGDNTAPWLRIRIETKGNTTKTYFTLKKSITNQMDSIEHETVVDDAEELEAIIKHLDFTLYSDLTKTRQKAHVGEIEICLDAIEGLGTFIEAEKLTTEDAQYELVVEELWAILEQFGASRQDEVTDGYDVLMKKHRESTTEVKD